MKTAISIFTDGSSRGNPGPGGWGAVIYNPAIGVSELGGADKLTTNNRMELTAAIEALLYLERKNIKQSEVTIHSDSAYVLNGITKWVYTWEKNNWFTTVGETVLNQDLWAALLEVARRMRLHNDIVWKKVEGHAGVLDNERADQIATQFADGAVTLLFSGSLEDYKKMVVVDTSTKKKKNTGAAYSYVSLVEGKIAIDKTWDQCEKRVRGKKGAKFKKALSKDDETELVRLYQSLI